MARADAHRPKFVVEVEVGPSTPVVLADMLVVRDGPLELRRLGPIEAFRELSSLLHCRGIATALAYQHLIWRRSASMPNGSGRGWQILANAEE